MQVNVVDPGRGVVARTLEAPVVKAWGLEWSTIIDMHNRERLVVKLPGANHWFIKEGRDMYLLIDTFSLE